jgi:hypothetical protein
MSSAAPTLLPPPTPSASSRGPAASSLICLHHRPPHLPPPPAAPSPSAAAIARAPPHRARAPLQRALRRCGSWCRGGARAGRSYVASNRPPLPNRSPPPPIQPPLLPTSELRETSERSLELGLGGEGRGARRIPNGAGDVFFPSGRWGIASGIANGDVCISC